MVKIRNLSIKKKIGYLFLGSFLIVLCSMISILYNMQKKEIRTELLQKTLYEDSLVIDRVQRMVQNVESCCNNTIINLNISVVDAENFSESLKNNNRDMNEKLARVITPNFSLFPEVCSISILFENGDCYIKENEYNYKLSFGNKELVQEFQNMNINTYGQWYYQQDGNSSLYYVKKFKNIKGLSDIGYILIELEEETFYEKYVDQISSNLSEIYIFDENGQLLSSSDRKPIHDIYRCSKEERLKASDDIYETIIGLEKKSYYVKEYSLVQGWMLISVLDLKAGLQGLRAATTNIILICVSIFAMLIWCSVTILDRITKPIIALAEHMQKTGENKIQKIEEPRGHDEIYALISSFNQLVDTNGKLIEKITHHEKEKRKMELSLLQAQIKPHFLYNTLDTAFCLNGMGMYKESNHVIKQLAEYYRLVLSNGREWISLREELDAVKKYLEIQSVRYSDLVSYNISVDEELYGFHIPKMTLQPLVENAIYHGLKSSGRKGHILITGEFWDGEIVLTITDDGVGMSQNMFDEILSGKRKSTNQESFGIKSVAERLKLFYGEHAQMELGDTAIGTSIILSIDLRKDEKE